jgi:tRNA/rRNA methyltransferase
MIQDLFHVVLVEPRYDGNIGSVARVMKNFGFKNLALVNPPPIGAEGRKNSMHARDLMEGARIFKSFGEAAEAYDFLVGTSAKVAGDANTLRTPVYPEELAKALGSKGKVALVFGREDCGLHNGELDRCDMQVTIPARDEYPTLNLSHSVGIILYELSKLANKRGRGGKKLRPLSAVQKRYMLKFFDELVEAMYQWDFEQRLTKRTFRQIIGRAFISGRESKTMTGVFRTAKEKIGKAGTK